MSSEEAVSWRESVYRAIKSGQQSMRFAVLGSKHDSSTFETLLQESLRFEELGCITDTMADTAVLKNAPKVKLSPCSSGSNLLLTRVRVLCNLDFLAEPKIINR